MHGDNSDCRLNDHLEFRRVSDVNSEVLFCLSIFISGPGGSVRCVLLLGELMHPDIEALVTIAPPNPDCLIYSATLNQEWCVVIHTHVEA